MFGLGFWEIAIILAIALIVLGPKKLPELARSLGKGLKEFRKATEDFKSTMDDELRDDRPRRISTPADLADAHLEAKIDQEKAATAEAEVVAEVEKAQAIKTEG